MGLDMYAFATKDQPASQVDFRAEDARKLHYWRKHPNLHGWMRALYYDKGGTDAEFNCVPVVLTAQDLDRLEAAIREGTLPRTNGFFFGESDGSEADDDLAFIAKARAAITEGWTVYYDSWW